MVGSPACGDMMTVWIKVDPASERIIDMKWRTFGCGSAIASTSMHSVMIVENGGRTLEEALAIKPRHIIERLAVCRTGKSTARFSPTRLCVRR